MMNKTVKIDFFRVQMPLTSQHTFSALLQHVMGSPQDDGRTLSRPGGAIRLQDVTQGNRFYEGNMMFIRMEDLPLKASLSGQTELFDLDDDEGIGDETAFLYDQELSLLLIHRNRTGVTPTALCDYLCEKCGCLETIELLPLLKADTVQRLRHMEQVRSFEIGFANINSAELLASADALGTRAFLELSQQFEAPRLTIRCSMGNRNGSLTNRVKEIALRVRELFNVDNGSVTKLYVGGVTGQESEVLDLLSERLIDQREVSVDQNRRVSYNALRSAVYDAWTENREYISSISTAKVSA